MVETTDGAISPQRLAESVDALRSQDLLGGELLASLQVVVDATCEVFGCDGAGVMLIDEAHSLHYVGATDGRAAAFEAAQDQTGEGPCVDSLINEHVVSTTNLTEDPRWPRLTEAIGPLGLGGVLGIPIRLGGATVGSLNTYTFAPHEWDDSEVTALGAHARILEELLGGAVLARQRNLIVEQLTYALEHRVAIERAIGIVMGSTNLDAVAAFNLLRTRARSERRRVSDVATEVLEARRFG